MPIPNYTTPAFALCQQMAALGIRTSWGYHYHAVHPATGTWHPQGATDRRDAAALVVAKWLLPLDAIHTIPCSNSADPASCPILKAALDKALADALDNLREDGQPQTPWDDTGDAQTD